MYLLCVFIVTFLLYQNPYLVCFWRENVNLSPRGGLFTAPPLRAGSTIIVDGRVAELESVCVLRRRSVLDVHDRWAGRKAPMICDPSLFFLLAITMSVRKMLCVWILTVYVNECQVQSQTAKLHPKVSAPFPGQRESQSLRGLYGNYISYPDGLSVADAPDVFSPNYPRYIILFANRVNL